MDTIEREIFKKLRKLIKNYVDLRTAPIDDAHYDKVEFANEKRTQVKDLCTVSVRSIEKIETELMKEADSLAAPGQTSIK